jgi:two-component system LytT family response regulator
MKTLIIDDERLARAELKSVLEPYKTIEIVGEASNANEGIEMIESLQPDLIFLDIQMPERTGFEMLEELANCPKVVFVTAYDEYAIKAFEVNAFDYLLKPVDPKRLEEVIEKLAKVEEEELKSPTSRLNADDKIFIKDGEKCWFVEMSKIRMFESDGNYVKVYFEKSRPLILRSLNSLEERLDPKTFFRANRKFIVNMNQISNIETWFNGGLQVELLEGEKVEISRRQAVKFKELMSL